MESLVDLAGRYGALAWKRRWWAATAAWAICVFGWFTVAMLPDQYEATAKVYIDADSVLTPLLRGITVEPSLSDELDLLQQMLLARPNIERIIAKTDLQLDAASPAQSERLVDGLSRAIKVVALNRSVFSITYRNSNRQLAADVVQAVLASFIENKAGDRREDIERATTFLDSQIASYETQLRDAEQRRAAFRKKYIDLLPGDGGGGNRLDQARLQVTQLTGQLEDALARRTLLAREVATTPAMESSEGGGPGGSTGTALRAAEEKLRSLQQVYTDAYPEVVTQKHLVESLRASTSGNAPTPGALGGRAVPNPVYEELKLRLVDTDAQIESLTRQVDDARTDRDKLEKMAKNVPEVEAQYANLNRDYDVLRTNYNELTSRREGMRISDAAQKKASNIKMVIIDPPTVPRVPIGPNRVLFAVGVVLAGLGGAVGVVVGMISFDQTFHTLADLKSLGLPVIGTVSLAAIPQTAPERARQIALLSGAFALLAATLLGVLMHFSMRN
jgi:polysaccharide chain length determinant protein (PEP-CTERM system associated)